MAKRKFSLTKAQYKTLQKNNNTNNRRIQLRGQYLKLNSKPNRRNDLKIDAYLV